MKARSRLFASLVVLSAGGFLACSSTEEPAPFTVGTEPLAARLETDLGAKVYLDQTKGRPYAATATEARIIAAGDTRSEAVRAFLTPYATDLGLAANDLEVAGEATDLGGLHHVVVRTKSGYGAVQRGDGIDVMTDAKGHFVALAGQLFPQGMITAPALPRADAERAALGASTSDTVVSSELSAFSPDRSLSAPDAKLAYLVKTTTDAIWVDATSGEILGLEPSSMNLLAPSVEREMVDDSRTFYRPDAAKDVEVSPLGNGQFMLRGHRTGSDISVTTLVGYEKEVPIRAPILSSNPADWDTDTKAYQGSYVDKNGRRVFLEPSSTGIAPRAAVDAYHAVALADTFFRNNLLRGPISKQDPTLPREQIEVVVHANFWAPESGKDQLTEADQRARDNASFNFATRAITFGDGPYFYSAINRTLPSTRVAPPALALDVVGHELAHAFGELTLGKSGEAGAINEGLADVVGTIFERENDPGARPDVLGERAWVGDCVRNISNPLLPCRATQGVRHAATYQSRGCTRFETPNGKNDWGCVHENATIVGHAFYLMAYGGENPVTHVAITRPLQQATSKAVGLAVHGLSTLYPFVAAPSTFVGVARFQIDTARTISPSEANTVACAWHAVGVIDKIYLTTMGFRCETSPPPSCVGRADGWYCDEKLSFAANLCKAGSLASGFQCGSGLRCTPRNTTSREADIVNGTPRCSPEPK